MIATVQHDGHNWVALPECGGATFAKRLEQLPERVREVVELMTGQSITAAELELRVLLPGAELAEQAKAARAAAERAAAEAAVSTAKAVQALRQSGLSTRDVAELVGISHQRVSQLTH